MDAAPLLRIRDLSASFAGPGAARVRAVKGVSLTVYPGQTLAVVGESGCGKSVTALSVLRLLPAPAGRIDGGSICFRSGAVRDELDLLAIPETVARSIRGNEISMVFQEPMTSLNPVFTVGDQISEAVRLHQRVGRRDARQTAVRAMEEVGVADAARRLGDYPHQFSGGMRQRVMIAMALACRPRLLLADEPTTALDVSVQAQILALLARIRSARGMGMMLITHDLGIVAQHADVVCVMYAGRVVEYAAVRELMTNPLHPYTRGLLTCRARIGDRRERLATVREVLERPGEFERLAGVRPWWPGHRPPPGVVANNTVTPDRVPDDFRLQEVRPEHWIGVWPTADTPDDNQRAPDLANVRDSYPVDRAPIGAS